MATLVSPDGTMTALETLDWDRLWFDDDVANELGMLRSLVTALPPDARVVAKTCLSSIIVAVSKQDSDTRYVRRKKTIGSGETCRRFLRALGDAVNALQD